MSAVAFMECPSCGSALVITDHGLIYCATCNPQGATPRNVVSIYPSACRHCAGICYRDGATCIACNGSGVIRADAAMRESWAYQAGYAAHGQGAGNNDSLFGSGTFADRCWRAGWLRAERDEIADAIAEKVEAERMWV